MQKKFLITNNILKSKINMSYNVPKFKNDYSDMGHDFK